VDLNKLSTSDKIVAGSGLLLFIASFLPWFGIEGFSGANGNGWDVGFLWGGIPALLGLACAGVVLASKLGDVKLPDLPVTWGQAILGAGALSALLVLLKLLLGYEVCGFGECLDLDRKWGLFVASIAAVGLAVGGFRKYQEGDDAPATGGGTGSAPF
jgi:hypothetical protein